jgi:predicted MFS family arabinose efflux permease
MPTSKIITRDFIFAFLAQFAFSSALFVLIPTLPIYLSRLKSPETEIGILIGVSSVSSLLIRPFVGRALLKISERDFMLGGAFLFTFSSIAYLFASPFWPLFIVRAFQGIGFALFFTASTTLIANISPEDRRVQSIGYFLLTSNIAFALVPSFGMFLINRFSFTILFGFCTVVSLGSLYLTTRLEKRGVVPLDNTSPVDRSFLSRKALPPSIMAFFSHIIWGAVTAFFPLYAIDQGVKNPGPFFATFAVMVILGRALGGRILDLYSRERIIFPCLMTLIISMIILAFSKTLPMFILAAMIWGIGNAFLFPTLVAYAIDLAGPSRGPALGTFTAFCDLGVGLGAVMMGIVLRWTNYRVMFLCLAVIGVIDFLYFNFYVKKRRV